ncbi:hypothetical protein LDENG_00275800 [Lucifuga dentata]|nr:hypothetical protein LDENG_00275800 [Lucifuga dentata]
MSLEVGGSRSTRRGTHADMGSTCKLHTERTCPSRELNPGPSWELNPGPSCCEATALTTVPPCCPYSRIPKFISSNHIPKFASLICIICI